MKKTEYSSPVRSMLESDSGMALAVVMLMSAVLFLLATTVLMLVSYRETQTGAVTERNQSMHIADAGINEYVYRVSDDNSYYRTNETLGPIETQDGQWTVTRSYTPSGAVLLTSVGILNNGSQRTVRATIRFPTIADYVLFMNESQSIGTGATLYGKVFSNGNISNSGVITGLAEAGGTCTWGTSAAVNYPGGYKSGVAKQDFTQLTTNLANMQTTASGSGTYYAPLSSPNIGYRMVMNGAQATIYKVTRVNNNYPRASTSDPPLGELTTTLVGTAVVPYEGVFFFDDDVWVSGNYAANVTVVTSGNMYLADHITLTNPNSNVTCGLISKGNLIFPYWYQTMPEAVQMQAAMLAQGGKLNAENPPTVKKYNTTTKDWTDTLFTSTSSSYTNYTYCPMNTSLNVNGGTAMFVASSLSNGFTQRNFNYDPRLMSNPPPMYPQLTGGELKVDTWAESTN